MSERVAIAFVERQGDTSKTSFRVVCRLYLIAENSCHFTGKSGKRVRPQSLGQTFDRVYETCHAVFRHQLFRRIACEIPCYHVQNPTYPVGVVRLEYLEGARGRRRCIDLPNRQVSVTQSAKNLTDREVGRALSLFGVT